jgi:hypothetical protein
VVSLSDLGVPSRRMKLSLRWLGASKGVTQPTFVTRRPCPLPEHAHHYLECIIE